MVQNTSQQELAFIALGANIGDRRGTFDSAVAMIDSDVGQVQKVSGFYETLALKQPRQLDEDQSPYLNAVLSCSSRLEPGEILKKLHKIEEALGLDRSQKVPWGPREIDLDLLAVGEQVLHSSEIHIPHPELHRRDFVLYPLQEIYPEFFHPVLRKNLSQLIEEYEAGDYPVTLARTPNQAVSTAR